MKENSNNMAEQEGFEEREIKPGRFQFHPQSNYFPAWGPVYEEEKINLLEFCRALFKRKWLVLGIVLTITFLTAIVSLILPPKYTSKVTLMTISSKENAGASGMAAQLTSLPFLGGGLGDLSEKLGGGKSKELVNILKSRTMSSKIIQDFNLMPVLFANQYDPTSGKFNKKLFRPEPVLEDGIKKFQKKIAKVEIDKKTGLIEIAVTLKNPKLAADIANMMVIELQDFIERNSLTSAKRNRMFIEEQLVKNRSKLLVAGKELNKFYADGRISSVDPEIDVSAGSYESVPETFEEFRASFKNLESNKADVEKEKEKTEIVTKVPGQVYLQYLTLNRDLLGKVSALLTQQFELAKIEEAREELGIQVIDKGEVMVRPSSPKVVLNVTVALVVGLSIGVFMAFFLEYLHGLKEKELAK